MSVLDTQGGGLPIIYSVARPDIHERVARDLAAGHTHVAIQRLRSRLAADPADTDLRQLLAAVYRQTGNLVQAGRWSYLTEDARPDELTAFTRSHPSARVRLRQLRWPSDPALVPGEAGRERLVALMEQAWVTEPPDEPVAAHPAPARRRFSVSCLLVALVLAVVGTLVGIGIVRTVQWLF